jgi:hypothetical protein
MRGRQPRTGRRLTGRRHWLWLSWALCVPAMAAPPPPPTQPAPAAVPQPPAPSEGAPDGEFIEFLGADDVGDAAWWEFLKKVPPRVENPPATSPQEAKQ